MARKSATKSTTHSLTGLLLAALLIAGCAQLPSIPHNESIFDRLLGDGPRGTPVDDWRYEPDSGDGFFANVQKRAVAVISTSASTMAAPESIGLSTGGAKDVNNFRENIEHGYLPLPSDLTYEGLYYDYHFETGEPASCEQLFCPSYAPAITKDPISGETERYLSVGLNSDIEESDFARKKLNLVIVLDISGSMSSPFDQYYYDGGGRDGERAERRRKIEVARESIVALFDHLDDRDRLGIVLYDDKGHVAKPIRYVGETDMDALVNHMLELEPRGGTNMEAGLKLASEEFEDIAWDREEYDNRIIFLTDAQPNTGDTSEDGLLGISQRNADRGVHTTFIGVGVDFNSELIESIGKLEGANYYSVHSSEEFATRMDDEFAFMVTPLVFDLELRIEAEGYEIEQVYGSPEADLATGSVMYVKTLFPSSVEEGETRGGIVLVQLEQLREDAEMIVTAKYRDRDGVLHTVREEVRFPDREAEYFTHSGVRKGVLLARYANLLQNWMIDEREHMDRPIAMPRVTVEEGILPPPMPWIPRESRWERRSIPLHVDAEYRSLIGTFAEYYAGEMAALGDDALEQELAILERLAELRDRDEPSDDEWFGPR